MATSRIRPPTNPAGPKDPRYVGPSYNPGGHLPPGAEIHLRQDHPRLVDLRQRYQKCTLPMGRRTMWRDKRIANELDLRHFRGDNCYVWQFRNLRVGAHYKYYFYMRDLAARDRLGLLHHLTEDGLFGCWTFEYRGWPLVSRDLLDSVNELYFLDRHLGLLSTPGMHVLDVARATAVSLIAVSQLHQSWDPGSA